MKTPLPSNKHGIALIIVMAILVVVTLLVAALLQLSLFNERETIRQLRQTQAHWLAEAGLERTISMIKVSKTYRDSLGSLNNPPVTSADEDLLLGGTGSYFVTIVKTDGPGLNESTFDIESSGTVSNPAISAVSSVRIHYTGAPGADQGFVALGGNSSVKSTASIRIDGDIYIAGDGTIGKNARINGTLEDGDDAYDLPDPAVDVPFMSFEKVDRSDYQALINTALTYPATNYSGSVVLNGGVTNFNGDVTISGISGSGGTVVASGTITIDNKQALPQNTRLVAGADIVFSTQTSAVGNNELFAFGNITFNTGSEIEGIGNTFMAIGGIFLEANSSTPFAGILYAEGLHPNSAPAPDNGRYSILFAGGKLDDMRGTVIAWQGFYIGANLIFTYDPSVFASPNPLDEIFNDFVPTRPLQWEQTPYQTP